MTKKLSLTLTAIITTAGLMAFSVSNAFALDGDAAPQDTAPLTSAKQICNELTASYAEEIENAKAFGLSLQKTKEEIAKNIKDIKDAKKLACKEAKTEGQPLTSAVQLCKEAKKNYNKDIKNMKAKGLSQQMTKEEIAQMLKDLKDAKKKVCAEAKDGK